jgi:hypothetical protein
MDYFSRKSLSKYLMNTIDFKKQDINIFINDTWQKYAGDIGWLFKIARRLELHFWPRKKRSQPWQCHFFARIALKLEPWFRVGLDRFHCIAFNFNSVLTHQWYKLMVILLAPCLADCGFKPFLGQTHQRL